MKSIFVAVLAIANMAALFAVSQGIGSAGSISGIVTDSSGAVVAGATVELQNRISYGYDKSATTDNTGAYHSLDLPPNNYHLTAVNVTNVVAVYDFLSTFSSTHFVSPRAYTLEIGMVW